MVAPKIGLKPEVSSVAVVVVPNVPIPDEATAAVWAEDEEQASDGVGARVAVGFTRPNRPAPLEGGCRG